MLKKAICFILMAASVLCAVSCGSADQETAAVSSDDMQTSSASAETSAAGPSIPRTLDCGGKKLTVLLRTDMTYEFNAESETGDVVNDAVFRRNQTVEEQLKLSLVMVDRDCSAKTGTRVQYNDAIRQSVQSGSDDYQFITNYAYYGVDFATEGFFHNLLDIGSLDIANPWWNGSFVDELNIYDQLYFIIGDMTTTVTEFTPVTFVDNKYLKNYLGDVKLYERVDSGGWTLDYVAGIVKDIYKDMNGDGVKDKSDFYGLGAGVSSMALDGMLVASGIRITEHTADGGRRLSMTGDAVTRAVEKLYTFYYESSGIMRGTRGDSTYFGTKARYYMAEKFARAELMMGLDMMQTASLLLRDYEDDYSILPLPKYDEKQDKYYTTPQDAYSIISVPITFKDTDTAGVVLENLGYQSYELLRPAYFEVAYKTKYLRDSESARMFELILDSVLFDFGISYSSYIGSTLPQLRQLIEDGSKDWSSKYASLEAGYTQKMGELLGMYKKLG